MERNESRTVLLHDQGAKAKLSYRRDTEPHNLKAAEVTSKWFNRSFLLPPLPLFHSYAHLRSLRRLPAPSPLSPIP
jgi:hypothetical protein